MTIRFRVEPRDVPPEIAARRLGLSVDRFEELLPRLLSRGFPPSDPDTGNYDLDAVDAWRAARHRKTEFDRTSNDATSGLVAARLENMGVRSRERVGRG